MSDLKYIQASIFKEPNFNNDVLTSKGVLYFTMGLFDVVKYCMHTNDPAFSIVEQIKKYWYFLGITPNLFNPKFKKYENLLFDTGWKEYAAYRGLRFMKNILVDWHDILSFREPDVIEKIKAKYPEKEYEIIAGADFGDHNIFKPLGSEKQYDLIYTGRFLPVKRHDVLLKNLIKLKKRGINIKTLILSYHAPYNSGDYEREIRKTIKDNSLDVEIIENIPDYKVNEYVNKSKAGLMLSLREGANLAVTEYMMADIPVIAMRKMKGGGILHFSKECGVLTDERSLSSDIVEVIRDHDKYHPRRFILSRVNKDRSNERLIRAAKRLFRKRKEKCIGRFHEINLYNFHGYYYDMDLLVNKGNLLRNKYNLAKQR